MVLVIQSLFGFLWVPFYGGGGEGQKMEGKGREENSFHSTFLAHFVFILYSKSNMSPLEGRLRAISLFWQSLLP